MNKHTKAVLTVIFYFISPLVSAEVRLTADAARKMYQSTITSETYLSEIKIGGKAFIEYSVHGCFDGNALRLIDQKVTLEWPDSKYDKLAFAATKESEDTVSLELAVNKGEVDGAEIPSKFYNLFRKSQCTGMQKYPFLSVMKLFKVVSIEGLTDMSDLVDRAEHLGKIYAK